MFFNIKYELTQEQIKPIETKKTSLIIQQNSELIKYTNKYTHGSCKYTNKLIIVNFDYL